MRKLLLQRAVLPIAAALTPFKSHRYLRELCDDDFLPLDAQVAKRQALLAELLEHAGRETELYAGWLGRTRGADHAAPEAFASLPITRKDDLREGFPDRQLARSYRRRRLRYSNTSGTTGRPLLLIQDATDISWKYASILRSRVLAGLDPMCSQARVTPNECQPALPGGEAEPTGAWWASADRAQAAYVFLERQVINPYLQRRRMLEPFWGIRADTGPVDLQGYLDRIEQFDPDYLTLYPLYALLLADELKRSGRRPPTRRGVIDFSAAMCTPSMRARITEAFDRPTAQGCGGCEFARYAASCPEDPDRMHIAETYCYVETLRPDGTRCDPGELGNVMVTSLHSRAMPILRLEPGDVARIIEEPCSCGRNSRRIEHHGRVHSVMKSPAGWVTGRQVWDAMFAIDGVALFELHQVDEGTYRLAILPSAEGPPDETAVRQALGELLGEVSLEIALVDRLRTQASGKLQLVHSTTFDAFRVPSQRAWSVPVN